MTIELKSETLLSVADVPRCLPSRPGGRRVHVSAVYRWIHRGVRCVRLEAVRVGGTMYTSEEALERFARRLSQSSTSALPEEQDPPSRDRRLETVTRRLDALLGPSVRTDRQDRGA